MATADELARTAAPRFDFQLRFYVGGKHDLADLSSIAAGEGYDPTAETVLTDRALPSSTGILVEDTSDFPSEGVIVVGPGATGEQYEVIRYTGKGAGEFTGLERFTNYPGNDPPGGLMGYHEEGAAVTQWVDITNLVTGNLTIGMQERDGIGTWDVSLGGHGYNSRLIQQDVAVLGMWRFRPASGVLATWTDWTVAFLGYLQSVQVEDTSLREKRWTAQVQGLAQYLADSDCPPVYVGKQDLAEGKSVKVSSTLSDPWAEKDSGEYVGFPSLEGANLVDDDMSTLWISQDVPSVTVHPTHANGLRINEVFLTPRTGLPALQWFELFYKWGDDQGDDTLKDTLIVATCTNWKSNGDNPTIPETGYVGAWDSKEFDEDGQFLLICSDKAEFERRWSVYGAEVLDWRDKAVGTFSLNQAAGFLCLLKWDLSRDDVWWNTAPADIGGDKTPVWTGSQLTFADLAGKSLARTEPGKVTNPSRGAFGEDTNPTPGGYDKHEDEYASVDLGEMGHKLTTILLAGDDHLHVDDTLGFTDSGSVMIDAEVITYTGRDDQGEMLTGLGAHGEHAVDAVVKPYEGGVAYNVYQVNALRWRRRRVLSGGKPVTPTQFCWYLSDDTSPIYPDDANWDDDWADYWLAFPGTFDPRGAGDGFLEHAMTLDPPVRARHVMLAIRAMSDAGRAKLNQLHAYAPTQLTDVGGTQGVLDGVESGYAIKYLLVNQFGLAETQFTMTDKGVLFTRLNTAKARYLDVIANILKRSGCSLYFGLDETVEHKFSPGFALHALDPIAITWDRDNARAAKMIRPKRHNVSQVVLRAMDDSEEGLRFEVRYPPEPLPLGSVLTIEDMVLNANPSTACLVAQQIFRRRNGPAQVMIQPVGPAEWVRPGQRHVIDWSLDTEGAMIADANFAVTGVQFNIGLGSLTQTKTWDTTIILEELIF